jgi:hypothetical protein
MHVSYTLTIAIIMYFYCSSNFKSLTQRYEIISHGLSTCMRNLHFGSMDLHEELASNSPGNLRH